MRHEEVIDAVADWFRKDRNVVLVAKGYGRFFPNPDVQARYRNNKVAFVECKPSGRSGREYLTGLGQCLAYLTFAEYSYLALPREEMKKYMRYFWVEEVGLLSVKPNLTVELIRRPQESKVMVVKGEPRVRGYGYYRDLKPLEIHAILKAIHKTRVLYDNPSKDIVEAAIWQEVLRLRNIKSKKQKNSWILNIKLLLRDLQLINPSDYSLTEDGFRLLQLGNLPDRRAYLDELTRCFLLNANYIDIVTLIQEINDEYRGFNNIQEFKKVLSERILKKKLATKNTNVMRDLQDILRILRELGILSDWRKFGLGFGQYSVNWKRTLTLISNR